MDVSGMTLKSGLGRVVRRALGRTVGHTLDQIGYVSLARAGGLGERAKSLLGLMSPLDPLAVQLERLGDGHDGGYAMITDLLNPGGIAYSFGIADNVSWDKAIAARGYTVFQYDHTIEKLPESHPSFRFFRTGVCASGREDAVLRSLDAIVEQNDHRGESDMLLKMDVEGSEWDVFSTIPDATLRKFSQIVLEFHELDNVGDDTYFRKAEKALATLRRHFTPVHVHGNNNARYSIVGGVPTPRSLEVSYVRCGLVETGPCRRCFPTEIDRPNDPSRPDLFLGSFAFR